MASTMLETYITGLKNAHALESQAVQLLRRQVERLENYPEMSAKIEQHIAESEMQQKRLESLLERHGTSYSSIKDFVTGMMGNIAAMAHAPASDEVVKNSFANFAFEHYEIAAYRALIALAQAVGAEGDVATLRESLAEEERTAEWIGQRIEQVMLEYARREESGLTAGV
ncbi:ferritin-like domain-containing protein [Sediminicoccus sp. BL-A-41-H5]|jgi:ferritin-like metal-binding protein YciE|uniref:ferritin-like domain-containing protein n=1 Tax=Sediminicoccus sp. BL-A-41-H5 TaxID=3421106 RepID=UPI003D67D76F